MSRHGGQETTEIAEWKAKAYADADAHDCGGRPRYLWKVTRSRGVPTLSQLPINNTITLINSDPAAPGGVVHLCGGDEVRGDELRAWADYAVARALKREAHEPGSERSQVARPKRVGNRAAEKVPQDPAA